MPVISFVSSLILFVFVFNDTATTEIYTLSLHDALPISPARGCSSLPAVRASAWARHRPPARSEEHTSELQSRRDRVCRLLLEKTKECGRAEGPTAGRCSSGEEPGAAFDE